MATENDPQPDDDERDDDQATFRVTGVEVFDNGRVRIPGRFRDRYDIAKDDIIDVRVLHDGVNAVALDRPIDGEGRVRIPARKRKLYDIEDGDTVSIDVALTPFTNPD